jgi:phage terminase small subunit
MEKVLTERQELFCQIYVDTFLRFNGRCNATRAAIEAGYSKKSSRQHASRMMTNANIKKRIAELQEERKEYLSVTAQKIIDEYAKIGFADLSDYLNEWGYVSGKDLKKLPKHLTAAIKSIEKVTNLFGAYFKITLHDKKGALDALAKIEGILKDGGDRDSNPEKLEGKLSEIADYLKSRNLEIIDSGTGNSQVNEEIEEQSK